LIPCVQAEKLEPTGECIEQEKKMTCYRCHLMDAQDRTRALEDLDCADDAAALLEAERLLAAWGYHAVELWRQERLVGKWGATAGDNNADIESCEAVPAAAPGLRPQTTC
jgi:hypothetical protein